MAPPSPLALLVEGAIWSLWALLTCLDVGIVAAGRIRDALLPPSRPADRSGGKPRVVILGASFAGLAAQRELCLRHRDEVDVTVIDFKGYFEYVPGVLRCLVDPAHHRELTFPLSDLRGQGAEVIVAEVVGVDTSEGSGGLKDEVILKGGDRVPYDYLILAAGSTYAAPIKATVSEQLLSQRRTQWAAAAADLRAARTVAVVGAGAVGVELAGEILTAYPGGRPTGKRVILIDAAAGALTGFPRQSVEYATRWLEGRGAELRLGSPPERLDEKSVTFADGTTVEVDMVYRCYGALPNTSFLKEGNLMASLETGPRGAIVVNDHLQARGMGRVFCAGDLCHHAPSNELKLGHTAEVNAHLVSENVMRLIRAGAHSRGGGDDGGAPPSELLTYPLGVVGNHATPKIYDISLGKYDGTLGFNSLVVHGPATAVLKWLLEWTKVAAARGRPVGVLFWAVSDAVSNLLGRTVLPTASPVTSKGSKKK